MENIKYIPLALLCSFAAKCLFIAPPGINEVLVGAILAGSYLFMEYKEPNFKIKKLQEDFALLTAKVEDHTKIVEVVKNNMSSIKIAQAYSSKPNSGFGSK